MFSVSHVFYHASECLTGANARPFPVSGAKSWQVLLKSSPREGSVQLNHRCARYNNYTALHLAVLNSHLSVVETLLQGLAAPSVRDADGRTPLDLAVFLRDSKPEMYVFALCVTSHMRKGRSATDCGPAHRCGRVACGL
jgi:hypothetical protein